LDVQMSLRGLLRGFGLKVGPTTPSRFAGRIRDLVEGNATLEIIAAALLAVHETLRRELAGFEKRVCSMALARKLAVIMHRMLVDGTLFKSAAVAALTGRVQRISGGARHQPPETESLAGTMDQVRPLIAEWRYDHALPRLVGLS
jgi:hypothetical protein